MKTNPLILLLLGALIIGACATFGLAVGFERHFRTMRVLQGQMVRVQTSKNIVNALADDATEYSKRNPAIDPILQTVNVKPSKAAPASKP